MSRFTRRGVVAALVGSAAGSKPGLGWVARPRRQEGEATPAPAGTPGDVLLVLGDSLATGIGASDPVRRGFAAVLHGYLERLAGQTVELVNLAIPGETTASFLADGQLAEARRTIAYARGAGLRVSPLVVSLGGNDLLRAGRDDAALEAGVAGVATNLARIFAELRAATADSNGVATADPSSVGAGLLAVTVYEPGGSDPARPGSDAWWVNRLNAAIMATTEAAGGRSPDLAPLVRGREAELTWFPADIHPTNEGHAVIARALWAATGYDVVPPVVTLLRPGDGPLPRPQPTIAATAEDQVGVEEVVALLDDRPLGTLEFFPEAGAYLLLWDARALSPGNHRLELRAVDAAGNVGQATATVQPAPSPIATPAATPAL